MSKKQKMNNNNNSHRSMNPLKNVLNYIFLFFLKKDTMPSILHQTHIKTEQNYTF